MASRKHTESTDFKDLASKNYGYSAQKPSLQSKYDFKQKRSNEPFSDLSKKDPIYKSYARNYTNSNEPAPQPTHERKPTSTLENYYPGKYAQESARKEAVEREEYAERKTPFRTAASPTAYVPSKTYVSSNFEDSKVSTNHDLRELYKKIEKLDSTLTSLENKNKSSALKDDLNDKLTIGSGASFNYVQSRDNREDSALYYNSPLMKTEGSAEALPDKPQPQKFEFKGKGELGGLQDSAGFGYARPSTSYKPSSYLDSAQRERERPFAKTYLPAREAAEPKEDRDYRLPEREREKETEYDQILKRRGTTPLKTLVGSALYSRVTQAKPRIELAAGGPGQGG